MGRGNRLNGPGEAVSQLDMDWVVDDTGSKVRTGEASLSGDDAALDAKVLVVPQGF